MLNEIHKITASDADGGDHFGLSVSVSGNRVVVGALSEDSHAGRSTGAAYVFRLDDNGTPSDSTDDSWVEEAKLRDADPVSFAQFGRSVSISGSRVVVGKVGDDAAGFSSGAAYVFRLHNNGTPTEPGDDAWIQETKLTASDAQAGDQFGKSVSIRGDWIIVGADRDDDLGNRSGSAYVFYRTDNGTPSDPSDDSWVEQYKLLASDGAERDFFGTSVDITVSGHKAIVGAPFAEYQGRRSGLTYVFARDEAGTPSDLNDDSWSQEAELVNTNGRFGASVSISGNRAIVGAYLAAGEGVRTGAAHVFRYDEMWVEEAELTASDAASGASFGEAVSINGTLAIVGAPRNVMNGSAFGAVYIFEHNDNGTPQDVLDDFWREVGKLAATDHDEFDLFGQSVCISGEHAVVGAFLDDDAGDRSGSAYIYSIADIDLDEDGVLDECDDCPDSDLLGTIMIHGCDTNAGNQLFDDGCTMADLITGCEGDKHHHGDLVACVKELASGWRRDRIITGHEFGKIMSCAARDENRRTRHPGVERDGPDGTARRVVPATVERP